MEPSKNDGFPISAISKISGDNSPCWWNQPFLWWGNLCHVGTEAASFTANARGLGESHGTGLSERIWVLCENKTPHVWGWFSNRRVTPLKTNTSPEK